MKCLLNALLISGLMLLPACGDGADKGDGNGNGNGGGNAGAGAQQGDGDAGAGKKEEDASAKAAGKWVLDSASLFDMNKDAMLKEVPEAQRAMAEPMMKQMLSKMQMSFDLGADGKTSGTATMANPLTGEEETQTMSGSWTLDGEKITINAKGEGEEEEKPASGVFDGESIVLEMDQGGKSMKMKFVRG